MNSNNSLVSIIIPTYNRTELLKLAVDSVLNQTFKEWELIIIDSGTDGKTEDMIRTSYEGTGNIRYFRIEKSKNPGISTYLNYGIGLSRGKYIARLDDDDTWFYREKLEEQFRFLEENPDYVLVGGGVIMIDKNRKEMKRYIKKETDSEIRKYALLSCPFDHPAVVFRKDAFDRTGGYSDVEIGEDWILFLKLGLEGKFYNMQKYYIEYLQAAQGMSYKNELKTSVEELKTITKFRKHYPNYWLGLVITTAQMSYSILPSFIRNKLHYKIRYVKRKLF